MEAEKLKLIAEGMGYTNVFISEESGLLFGAAPNEGQTFGVYHPDENNDQMVEIMERLKFKLEFSGESWDAELEKPFIYCLGKTINEAVCNAAFAFFDEKTN